MKIREARLKFRVVGDGEDEPLDSPEKVVRYVAGAFVEDPTVEWFLVVPMDRKNHPLARIVVTRGTATSSLVHPREVFRPVILANASAFAVAHNHPSGDPAPSRADIQVTRQLRDAAKTVSIDMLDHVIVGAPERDPLGYGYYSFNDAGLIDT